MFAAVLNAAVADRTKEPLPGETTERREASSEKREGLSRPHHHSPPLQLRPSLSYFLPASTP